MERERLKKLYMWLTVALGALVLLFSAYNLPLGQLGLPFLLLVLMTIGISSSVAVPIPRVSGGITVSDTFVFLAMLLYGGEAAVLLAAAEGVCSSLRISRRPRTILFNSAVLAWSTFLTAGVLSSWFGPVVELPRGGFTAKFFIALCVMAFVQYVANTGLIAVEKSFKTGLSVWQTWYTYYLWTSVTYFAGASAAGLIAKLAGVVGLYALAATLPLVAIIYLTYRTYLKNIEAMTAQAELARRHIEQLDDYIAKRKLAEEERDLLLIREREARAEAEAANRIKDEFLTTLSHELRTPLTSIVGWAGLLRGGGMSPEMQAQALESIQRNAKAQAQLIDDLLDVSRIISGKLRLETRQLDLNSVIEAAIEVVRPAAEAKKIQILYTREPSVGPVMGDAGRLQQVAWNLFSNAVKFTPEGGRVEVRLERVGSKVRMTVSDTGRGIRAEFLPHVFERFRQADSTTARDQGGLGLGLAIVRHLVELHGGTVSAESPGEGQGATFSVTLPPVAVRMEAGAAERDYQRAAAPFERARKLQGLRVLVVDDVADARQMISAVLSQSGAEVKTSASTREALEVLEQWEPDVLVSDIGMPGEDGYALIREVRALEKERGVHIPAAALTAYARDEDRTRAIAAGYETHVAKPVGPNELVMTVAGLAGCAAKID